MQGGFSGFRLGVRYSLFWEFTQRRLIVNSRRLGTASRSHLKCRAVQEYCLALENVTNRLSRNVVNYLYTLCVKSQKSEDHKLLVMNKAELSYSRMHWESLVSVFDLFLLVDYGILEQPLITIIV